MSFTAQRILASLLPASGFLLCLGMAAQADPVQSLPVDQPAQVMGVKAACTGVGNREENEARWSSYPLKIEAVGGYGQWLGNEQVTLRGRDGAEIMDVRCAGPWVLMGLHAGHYDATVRVANAPAKQIAFTVPRAGQRDVIVRFKSLTNGEETQHPASGT